MIEDDDPNGLQRRTEYQYNGNGDITKLIARDVGEYGYDGGDALEDQVTEYVYGNAINSRWVTEIRYPGSNGQASSASSDKVVFAYHYDGTVNTRTDQNGSVLTYDYDSARRKQRERLTTVGSGVDDAVKQLVWTYADSGRVQRITSRDSGTADAGSVVNEVKFTYDDLGALSKDEQEHDGAVDGSTLAVQYTQDVSGSSSNNYARLNYLTYPNARTLYARYTHTDAASTALDEKAEAFNMPIQWADTSSGDVYVEYTYAGRSRLIERASAAGSGLLGNDSTMNYDAGTAGNLNGLDTFGRVVQPRVHEDGSTSTVRTSTQYEANRDGSPQYAQPLDLIKRTRASVYSYDSLKRLTGADVGRKDPNSVAIFGEWTTPQELGYTMDILGNITTLDRKNSGTSANETRSYNATNELTSRTVAGEAVRTWVDEPFTDNDTVGWELGELDGDPNTSDGAWSAASGKLSCSSVISGFAGPAIGSGSLYLIKDVAFKNVALQCTAEVDSGCDKVGWSSAIRTMTTSGCSSTGSRPITTLSTRSQAAHSTRSAPAASRSRMARRSRCKWTPPTGRTARPPARARWACGPGRTPTTSSTTSR